MFCASTFFCVILSEKLYIYKTKCHKNYFCMIFVMFYSVLLFTKKTFNLNRNYE